MTSFSTSDIKAVPMQEKLLTVSEVAEILNVSPLSLYNRRSRERYGLRSVRLGDTRTLRFRRCDVLAVITRGIEQWDEAEVVA